MFVLLVAYALLHIAGCQTINGTNTSHSVCNGCVGHLENVFDVESGGYIPSNFAFNNWFLLTNTSSVVDGVVSRKQTISN